ncbi:MAG: DUF72 domain-containing protein [Candidatus Hadarchaeales archaeon]
MSKGTAIRVGCCGWGFYRGGLKEYCRKFGLVEVQQTFYRLPMVSTAQRWREEVPREFEFTVKAWQAITHPPSSPTWRRSGLKPEELSRRMYGWLRPTKDNFEAWDRTAEICSALRARVCVIQTPPNFGCTSENIRNMREFLSSVERQDLVLAWEPRGDWNDHPDEIKKVCDELDLAHVVDLMRRDPLSEHPVAYIRLHGLNPREHDYNYRYSDNEIMALARKARALAAERREVYVMFNNVYMYESAEKLEKVLGKRER